MDGQKLGLGSLNLELGCVRSRVLTNDGGVDDTRMDKSERIEIVLQATSERMQEGGKEVVNVMGINSRPLFLPWDQKGGRTHDRPERFRVR